MFKGKLEKAIFSVVALTNPGIDGEVTGEWLYGKAQAGVSLKALWVEPWLQPQNTGGKERS